MKLFDVLKQNSTAHLVPAAPLGDLNTFGVGGQADLLVVPSSMDDVVVAVQACREHASTLHIMGAGSNIIVPDAGIAGVVLRLPSTAPVCRADGSWLEAQVADGANARVGGLGRIRLAADNWIVGAGVFDPSLAHFAWEHGVTGFEWMYDIPGSVGGAVFMNAGNNDGEMSHSLVSARWIDPQGTLHDWSADKLAMTYRHTILHDQPGVVVEATVRADNSAPKDVILQEMRRIRDLRRSKFPRQLLCAGSVFKRPSGHYAGKLIEDAGLGGLQVGHAMVAEEHKGFIINLGKASASDLLALIEQVQQRVWENSGIRLETEVELFGQRPFVG